MSASEIIDAIQKLPAAEQDRIFAFVESALRNREPGAQTVRYADNADFEKVADKVLREHDNLFRRLAQ